MERTLAVELGSRRGERVRIAGWLHHQRQLAKVAFVLVRDRSGIAQVVLVDPAERNAVARLLPETVLEVEGTAVRSEQAPAGVELVDPEHDTVRRLDTHDIARLLHTHERKVSAALKAAGIPLRRRGYRFPQLRDRDWLAERIQARHT